MRLPEEYTALLNFFDGKSDDELKTFLLGLNQEILQKTAKHQVVAQNAKLLTAVFDVAKEKGWTFDREFFNGSLEFAAYACNPELIQIILDNANQGENLVSIEAYIQAIFYVIMIESEKKEYATSYPEIQSHSFSQEKVLLALQAILKNKPVEINLNYDLLFSHCAEYGLAAAYDELLKHMYEFLNSKKLSIQETPATTDEQNPQAITTKNLQTFSLFRLAQEEPGQELDKNHFVIQ